MANEELTCMKYSAFRGFIPLVESLIRMEEQQPLTFLASNFKDQSYVWSRELKIVAPESQFIDLYIHAFSRRFSLSEEEQKQFRQKTNHSLFRQ